MPRTEFNARKQFRGLASSFRPAQPSEPSPPPSDPPSPQSLQNAQPTYPQTLLSQPRPPLQSSSTLINTPGPSPPGPIQKRKRASNGQDRKDPKFWKNNIQGRKISCERMIDTSVQTNIKTMQDVLDPVLVAVERSIRERGITRWFSEIKGFIPTFVREFYTTLTKVRGEGGSSLRAKVKGRDIVVTPDSIANFLGCTRPRKEDIQYPKPPYNSPRDEALAQLVCTDVSEYNRKGSFTQGMLKADFALMNKVVHFNIFPKGAEKIPTLAKVQLVYELMCRKVIDIPMVMWLVIEQLRTTSSLSCSLPFGFMITSLCLEAGARPGVKDVWHPPALGAITNVTVKKNASKGGAVRRASVPVAPSPAVPSPSSPSSSGPSTTVPTHSRPSTTVHGRGSTTRLAQLLTNQETILRQQTDMERQFQDFVAEYRRDRDGSSYRPDDQSGRVPETPVERGREPIVAEPTERVGDAVVENDDDDDDVEDESSDGESRDDEYEYIPQEYSDSPAPVVPYPVTPEPSHPVPPTHACPIVPVFFDSVEMPPPPLPVIPTYIDLTTDDEDPEEDPYFDSNADC